MPDLTDREMLTQVCDALEAAVSEADRPPGGMSVPYHGDFASVVRQPGAMRDVRWWARRLREHLDSDTEAPSYGEPSEDDDDDPSPY